MIKITIEIDDQEKQVIFVDGHINKEQLKKQVERSNKLHAGHQPSDKLDTSNPLRQPLQKGWKYCQTCGKPFKFKSPAQVRCSYECGMKTKKGHQPENAKKKLNMIDTQSQIAEIEQEPKKYHRTVPHLSTAKKKIVQKKSMINMEQIPGVTNGKPINIKIDKRLLIDTKSEHYPTAEQLKKAQDYPYNSDEHEN